MALKGKTIFRSFAKLAPLTAFVLGAGMISALAVLFVAPPALPRGEKGKIFAGIKDTSSSAVAAFLSENIPHPTGSEANARMRAAIVTDLVASGYDRKDIRIEAYKHANRDTRGKPFTPPRNPLDLVNVVLELRGSEAAAGAGRIVVVCHYDSVSSGPGAGDDGFGVLACLGALRALKSGEPLKGDVVFLFSDAEETGLTGSSAAVALGGMAAGASFVINMEGLERGIVIPLEMSSPNGKALAAFESSFPRPFVSGLLVDFFRIMPFCTDLNEFEEAGARGITLAPVSTFPDYHTAADTFDKLDGRSMAQAARGLETMLRRLDAEAGKPARGETDWIAQSLLPGLTLRYPTRISWLVAVLPTIAFAVLAVLALRSGKARIRPALASLGISFLALALGAGAAYLVHIALGGPANVEAFFRMSSVVRARSVSRAGFLLAASMAVPALAAGLPCLLSRKFLRGPSGAAGALALLLVAATALQAVLPRSAPLLLIPAYVAVAAFGLMTFLPSKPGAKAAMAFALGAGFALTAAPSIVIFNATIPSFGLVVLPAIFVCLAASTAFPYLIPNRS